MTDKSSERAAWEAFDNYTIYEIPTAPGKWVRFDDAYKIIHELLDSAADSANLARGVAIEQAAQLSDEHFRKSSSPPMSIDWQRMTQAIRSLASPDAAQALAAHDAAKDAEIAILQSVCAEAYQIAGAAGAPVRVLDQFMAAASGKSLPHETVLPVTEDEFDTAELERRARLDEIENLDHAMSAMILEPEDSAIDGKWWNEAINYVMRTLSDRRQVLAALAESQPAPAKEDE